MVKFVLDFTSMVCLFLLELFITFICLGLYIHVL